MNHHETFQDEKMIVLYNDMIYLILNDVFSKLFHSEIELIIAYFVNIVNLV